MAPALPVELKLEILDLIRPAMIQPKPFTARYAFSNYESDAEIRRLAEYYKELKRFAQLRRISREWDIPVARVLYRHVVVPSRPAPIARQYLGILKHHANLIMILAIWDMTMFCGDQRERDIARRVQKGSETIDILNARLAKLEADGAFEALCELRLYGSAPAYQTRNWQVKTMPKVADTVTSLTLQSCTIKTIGLALVGQGKTLERLKIRCATNHDDVRHGIFQNAMNLPFAGETPIPLHLPSEMPHLKTLVLHHPFEFREYDYTKRIFGRVGAMEFCATKRKRVHKPNLNTLYWRPRDLSIDQVYSLLHANQISGNLQVLRLCLPPGRLTGNPLIATKMVEECRSLVELYYFGPFTSSILSALPPFISQLGLSLEHALPPMLDTIDKSIMKTFFTLIAAEIRLTMVELSVTQAHRPQAAAVLEPLTPGIGPGRKVILVADVVSWAEEV